MASRQVLLLAAAAIAVAFLPALTSAADYIVGGDAGWTLKYPNDWPHNKTFKVGDNLVFTYPKGEHTVVEVESQAFIDCDRQGNTLGTWVSGNDTVKIDKAVMKRWFFCSVDDHCEKGMKLVVEVDDDGANPPASPPESPPASPPASPPTSSAALSYKIGGAVAQAMVVAGAVVAAVFM